MKMAIYREVYPMFYIKYLRLPKDKNSEI